MKKLLAIVVLGLLFSGCQSQDEKNLNACIEDLQTRSQTSGVNKGIKFDKKKATRICYTLDQSYPEIFKKNKGIMLSMYTNLGISGGY